MQHLELATAIFKFLDSHLSLCTIHSACQDGYLAHYIQTGLTEQQMCLLAAILRDLDRDAAKNLGICVKMIKFGYNIQLPYI